MIRTYGVELRDATVTGTGIRGHAAVYGAVAKVGKGYETFERSAFDEVLARPDTDVRAFGGHNHDHLLGRQSSKTLDLWSDGHGLVFDIDLPDTSYANDLQTLVERGDIDGASFGFVPGEDRLTTAPDGLSLRSHTNVKELVEVSIVAIPAYGESSVSLRAAQWATQATYARSNRIKLLKARHRVRTNREVITR